MSKKLLEVGSKDELTKVEKYKLMSSNDMTSIKEVPDGDTIAVKAWALFVDVKEDEEDVTILSIMDTDGDVYCTNSNTFQRNFEEIADLYSETGKVGFIIKKLSGETKAGRPFVNCTLEGEV